MTRATSPQRERGNALIEFALAFTFISMMFIGVFQFGYSFYLYNNLLTNIRAGARYAAQKGYTPAPGSTYSVPIPASTFRTDVKNMVVYGTPTPAQGQQPVVPGLTAANVDVVPVVDVDGVPQSITVRISTNNPYNLNSVVANRRLRGKPAVSFPYTGVYSPAQ